MKVYRCRYNYEECDPQYCKQLQWGEYVGNCEHLVQLSLKEPLMTKKELAKIITSIISDKIHSIKEPRSSEDMEVFVDITLDVVYEIEYLSNKLYALIVIDETNVDRLANSLKITYPSYFK